MLMFGVRGHPPAARRWRHGFRVGSGFMAAPAFTVAAFRPAKLCAPLVAAAFERFVGVAPAPVRRRGIA